MMCLGLLVWVGGLVVLFGWLLWWVFGCCFVGLALLGWLWCCFRRIVVWLGLFVLAAGFGGLVLLAIGL